MKSQKPLAASDKPLDLYAYPDGHPAVDALGLPREADGRHAKAVRLVCPACGVQGIWVENSDTTLKFGDAATECQDCGLGHGDILDKIFGSKNPTQSESPHPSYYFDFFDIYHDHTATSLHEAWEKSDEISIPVLIGRGLSRCPNEVDDPLPADLEVVLMEDMPAPSRMKMHDFIGGLASTVTLDALNKLHRELDDLQESDGLITGALVKNGPEDTEWGLVIDMKYAPHGMTALEQWPEVVMKTAFVRLMQQGFPDSEE